MKHKSRPELPMLRGLGRDQKAPKALEMTRDSLYVSIALATRGQRKAATPEMELEAAPDLELELELELELALELGLEVALELTLAKRKHA